MNKAVFLDRDGTINVEKHYLHRIEDFEFLPGVIEGLRMLQGAGFLLIIVTNQSGIGRGYYTEADFRKLNQWMLDTLDQRGIRIDDVYYCPHLPDAAVAAYRCECDCRKPALGMYRRAAAEHQITFNGSYAIGDKLRDCAVCEATGCHGFLIESNESQAVINAVKQGAHPDVEYAENLLECAKKIAAMEETV